VIAVALSHVDAAGGVVHGLVVFPVSGSNAVPGETVIFVDSLPARAPRHWGGRPRTPRVVQRHQRFAPSVLAVVAGTTVQFHNRDRIYHNVFSVSPAKKFDLGQYPPARVNQVTFDRPGVVQLYCDLHPGEAGWIVVLPHRYFVQPERGGSFKLPWLPPGRYTLHLWHPTLGEKTRPLDVPERGNPSLRLSY
jgi:plastocyanin